MRNAFLALEFSSPFLYRRFSSSVSTMRGATGTGLRHVRTGR